HVLVDEFQDTSRAQWELVRQLVKGWGEGFGAAAGAIPPSIFIVGDRKQSIYGFRDADVAVIDEAAQFIEALRPDGSPRRAITVSFRSHPEILAFVNDVFAEIVAGDAVGPRRDAFTYGEDDRFPIDIEAGLTPVSAPTRLAGAVPRVRPEPVSFIGADGVAQTAALVADEITRLLGGATVRDRATGIARDARPADIAILFRSRDSHRDFESALERCN